MLAILHAMKPIQSPSSNNTRFVFDEEAQVSDSDMLVKIINKLDDLEKQNKALAEGVTDCKNAISTTNKAIGKAKTTTDATGMMQVLGNIKAEQDKMKETVDYLITEEKGLKKIVDDNKKNLKDHANKIAILEKEEKEIEKKLNKKPTKQQTAQDIKELEDKKAAIKKLKDDTKEIARQTEVALTELEDYLELLKPLMSIKEIAARFLVGGVSLVIAATSAYKEYNESEHSTFNIWAVIAPLGVLGVGVVGTTIKEVWDRHKLKQKKGLNG